MQELAVLPLVVPVLGGEGSAVGVVDPVTVSTTASVVVSVVAGARDGAVGSCATASGANATKEKAASDALIRAQRERRRASPTDLTWRS